MSTVPDIHLRIKAITSQGVPIHVPPNPLFSLGTIEKVTSWESIKLHTLDKMLPELNHLEKHKRKFPFFIRLLLLMARSLLITNSQSQIASNQIYGILNMDNFLCYIQDHTRGFRLSRTIWLGIKQGKQVYVDHLPFARFKVSKL